MLKVFLVEDEIVVREGIKNQINWEQEGFQFIGEASDGELAYPMIQTLKPDIVITDIKMPFVDGLELSRMIKEIQPEIKIIILSGYGEFDYAKEAIKIGITDYLLKPISSERLLDAVKAVGRSIEEERKQKNILFQFQEELQEKQERERQQLLYDLVSKEIPIKELGERAKELNLDLFACMYNIVLFKVYLSGDNIHSYSEHLVEVEDQIEQYLEKQDKVIFFRRQTEGSVLLFKVDSEQEFDTYSKKVMLGMVELLGKYNDLEYFFGIGKLVQRIREIPESFEEANRAFSYRYMVNNQHYITYEQIGTLNKNSEEEINLDLMDSAKIDRAIITNFLKSGLEEEVKHFLYDYFVGLGLSNLNSLLFRQYVALDLYLTTIGFLETILQDTTSLKEKFGNINSISNMITDINSTRDYLEEILRKAIEVRDTVSKKKYEDVIVKAKEYIFENYANENISLNSVAAFVNISPSYFSSLFSQETGHTFVEYLTNIRMDKAKQLLRCTSKKTSDIGYEVGYKDSHYFSYLFRKTQNCSPKEFRAKGKNG